MVKRIVICFDGTWNKPAAETLLDIDQLETNVRRFYESIKTFSTDGIQQIRWYDQGVGTKWYDHMAGGILGAGLEINIREGYEFLANNYQDSDEVYILGFSRGAYSARSLVGMISKCGLVHANSTNELIKEAFSIYRSRGENEEANFSRAQEFRMRNSREIPIKFLGVWDTVGARGIPLEFLDGLNERLYGFHNVTLSNIVEYAYQAIAVDEHREHYEICLWDPKEKSQQNMEQRWFCGAHSDIGGSYKDRKLSNITLRWMQGNASAVGLALENVQIDISDCVGQLTDSYSKFMLGSYAHEFSPYYRTIGATQFGNEVIDDSVLQRRKLNNDYKPMNKGLPL